MFSRRTLLLVPGAAVGAVGATTLLGPLVGRAPDLTPPGEGTAVRTDAGDGRLRLVPEDGGRVRSLEVPVGAGRFRSTVDAFSMVGVTWADGPAPAVEVRVRRDGVWGPWLRLPELTHGDVSEGTRHGTEPCWVGESDAVQTRIRGRAPAARVVLIDPGRPTREEVRANAAAYDESFDPAYEARDDVGTGDPTVGVLQLVAGGETLRPRIRSRRAWGANESWRDGDPRYNRRLKQVHVHHTVNGNSYSRTDVPGLIRGMYRYHTQSLGWSDIGYNFLVDRFGRIWEGRYGGAGRNVRGAHTLGFNHQSTGVALIGNHDTAWLGKRAMWGFIKIAAWKLDKAGIDPRQTVRSVSEGSDRYPAGTRVRLPAVDGHRDTNDTACPGDHAYARLPRIRRRAAGRIRRFHS